MKIDTDGAGNLVITATGHDTQFVTKTPQGIIIVLNDGPVGSLIEVWEEGGKIKTRRFGDREPGT